MAQGPWSLAGRKEGRETKAWLLHRLRGVAYEQSGGNTDLELAHRGSGAVSGSQQLAGRGNFFNFFDHVLHLSKGPSLLQGFL